MDGIYLYRVETQVDEAGKIYFHFGKYLILKKTEKGAWIKKGNGKNFVLTTPGKKRFAHKTKEEALAAFIHRKKAEVDHLERRLDLVKSQLYFMSDQGRTMEVHKEAKGMPAVIGMVFDVEKSGGEIIALCKDCKAYLDQEITPGGILLAGMCEACLGEELERLQGVEG